jgi:type II secretory pathway pseudopilin PulG
VYGVEWLIGLALVGIAAGGGIGYLLASRGSGGKRQLESDLQAARQELQEYRQAVVSEFSDTARKFQTLNDAYRDLHEQLARSSSALCGDITGPLLEAPAGHQDVIPADVRDRVLSAAPAAAAAGLDADPYEDEEIRVAEPPDAVAAAAAPADAGAVTGAPAAAADAAETGATAPTSGDEPPSAAGEDPAIQRREAAAG